MFFFFLYLSLLNLAINKLNQMYDGMIDFTRVGRLIMRAYRRSYDWTHH